MIFLLFKNREEQIKFRKNNDIRFNARHINALCPEISNQPRLKLHIHSIVSFCPQIPTTLDYAARQNEISLFMGRHQQFLLISKLQIQWMF